MEFYNISNPSERVSFRQAVLRSAPRVADLYMPVTIPRLSSSFIETLAGKSLTETAFEVSRCMLGGDLPEEVILGIVGTALNFDIPLRELESNLYVLELFHGPTLAFKDVGARYMSGIFEYLVRDEERETTVLVATSGDTGSAVANAFHNRKGINVVILFPSGKVSGIQEKQLTTMSGNISVLEIDGTFDDCQDLVKKAFSDKEINEKLMLTSANSINFARLFPQSIYYFHAFSQLKGSGRKTVFSVPSGNFGNLTAGLIAKRMGLPADRFVAATNLNRSVPDFLLSGKFNPKPTIMTITTAMDVGNPNNFMRLTSLYGNDLDAIRKDIDGRWFSDQETVEAMKTLWDSYSYIADPHGAVAFLGLSDYIKEKNNSAVFLETAHPVKFEEAVYRATGQEVVFPPGISGIRNMESKAIRMSSSFDLFREYLLSF